MPRLPIVLLAFVCSCRSTPASDRPRPIASTPIATTGPIARRLLATPGFTWQSFESPHVRLHLASEMAIGRVNELADSAESARRTTLALLGEPDVADEQPLELVLVETREDMRRLVGRPAAGGGFPDELSVVMVAGSGYRAFFRHEFTHTYAAFRWGRRQSGSWLDEGLATLATGPCQGYSIDAVAAGYIASGDSPPLDALTADFYAIAELPGYFTAASLVDFLRRREGVRAVRSIWRGEQLGTDLAHPLGGDTERLWSDWKQQLSRVPPAILDTARQRREGC